ncbi:hypothetical protein PoB_005577800 [Plakobranchus ocellatus]|uniref:C-type lectin domain-containing protein n=1 Tax=Plakobranchus ocellatus TaxID=259542 RepID=A0AAV4CBN2_9GAST|nr:hypothetical protein PoB_005577800 [Plakobranchus ocellatus]
MLTDRINVSSSIVMPDAGAFGEYVVFFLLHSFWNPALNGYLGLLRPGESEDGKEGSGKLPHNVICQEQSGPYSWFLDALTKSAGKTYPCGDIKIHWSYLVYRLITKHTCVGYSTKESDWSNASAECRKDGGYLINIPNTSSNALYLINHKKKDGEKEEEEKQEKQEEEEIMVEAEEEEEEGDKDVKRKCESSLN